MSGISERKERAFAKLCQLGQEHVFRFWNQISATEQEFLLQQVEELDEEFFSTVRLSSFESLEAARSLQGLEPFPVIPLAKSDNERKQHQLTRKTGEQLLRSGKVGIIMVAGGQGTRLGYPGPKGTIPVGPITNRSLFQYHFEKILALESRYQVLLPLYIMTSPWTDQQTRDYLREHNYFGKDPASVIFFVQSMLPALDENKKILLEKKYALALSPDGHGGLLSALKKHDVITDMKRRHLQMLFYFQVDNVLVQICDPTFIGFHYLADAEFSAKTVYKSHPDEKLGVIGKLDGRPVVIEYTEMPQELKEAKTEDGRLVFGQGSIAIHIFDVAFLERLIQSEIKLPYHIAHKKVAFIDSQGNIQKPDTPNAFKLEQFIFDVLPYAKKVMVMETRRENDFSPIKNSNGQDSLATAQRDLSELFASWLQQVHIPVKRDASGRLLQKIEISPLYALDAADLVGRVRVSNDMLQSGDILLQP